MAALLALLLTISSPPTTEWMTLESFHLAIGMPRGEALSALKAWNPKNGSHADQIVVDYAEDKSLTLEFRKDRLHSVRFELFVLLPNVRKAFDARRAAMGEPRKATKSILIYDDKLPNAMVVVADDPKSVQGKKGLGVLAVRYYDPR